LFFAERLTRAALFL